LSWIYYLFIAIREDKMKVVIITSKIKIILRIKIISINVVKKAANILLNHFKNIIKNVFYVWEIAFAIIASFLGALITMLLSL
jgi:hypothetical protein